MGADAGSEGLEPHEAYAEGDIQLAFGRRADGRILHVSEVVSGLACACVCPACAVQLVAKRGEIKEDHFAHHVVGDCRYAPQTSAHLFGKQVLEERKQIALPEIRGTVGDRSRVYRKACSYEFDSVALELRLGDIVPDVILRKGDRELLVEIFVTNRCDARKRQRIRELGISAIEVDLSGFRSASREEIVEAILMTAPREWLFNPNIDRIEAELRAEDEAAAERKRRTEERRIARMRQGATESRSRPRLGKAPADVLRRVRAKRLEDALGIEVAGDFCFAVSRPHWQAILLERCVLPLEQSPDRRSFYGRSTFKTKEALRRVEPFLHPDLVGFIDEETEKRVRESEPGFIRPYVVVKAYLEALQARGILAEIYSGWTISSRIEREWETQRWNEEEKSRRWRRILEAAQAVLAKLPEAEKRGFDVRAWARRVQPAFGCSFATCIEQDSDKFVEMERALTAIETMILRGGRIVDELLELPLGAEVRRQEQAREAARQERARQLEENRRQAAEAARLAAEERVRQITQMSIGCFGSAAWAETQNPALGGATPQAHARESSDRLNEALGAAANERRRQDERIEAAARREALAATKLSKLVEAVRRKLPEDRADVFLGSAHPKIGSRRPIDYCIDDKTLATCLSLLERASPRR